MTNDRPTSGSAAPKPNRFAARVILGSLVALAIALVGLPSISLGQIPGPSVHLLNPSSYADTGTPREIVVSENEPDQGPGCPGSNTEGRCEPNATYRLSAWTSNAPSGSTVFFEAKQGVQEVEIPAVEVVAGVWEAEWNIPDTFLNGSAGTITAHIASGGASLASDTENVTFWHVASNVDQMYPVTGGSFGTFAPLQSSLPAQGPPAKKLPLGIIDTVYTFEDTDPTTWIKTYYTTSPQGAEPEWIECAAETTGSAANGGIRCVLEEHAHQTSITAVASLANDSPDEPIDEFNQSGDVSRPTSSYAQAPTTLTLTNNRTQTVGTAGACSASIRAELDDQLGRHIAGANIDVEAEGPSDGLKFNNVATPLLGGQGQAPDRGGHTVENAHDCTGGNNPQRQGEHQKFGIPDRKHLENGSGGTNDDIGAYSFTMRSADSGGTLFTVWADEADDGCATNDDVFTSGEVFDSGSIGWQTDPPEPSAFTAGSIAACVLGSPSPTTSPSESPSPTTSPSPEPSGDRSISLDSNKSRVRKGGRVTFDGAINADLELCEDGERVRLRARRPGKKWKTIRLDQTNSQGRYDIKVRVRRTKSYKAVAPETADCEKAKSGIERVRVRQ